MEKLPWKSINKASMNREEREFGSLGNKTLVHKG